MSERGETLIAIPCWWDGTKERFVIHLVNYYFNILLFVQPCCNNSKA